MTHGSVASLLPWFCLLAFAQEPPTFEVQVDVVRLDVVVTHQKRPVGGLRATDFEVRDNGVLQQVRIIAKEESQAATNAVLVLDTSGSMAGTRLEKLRAAGHAFLDGLSDTDSASLIHFSDGIRLVSEGGTGRVPVHEALDAAAPGGPTRLYDAAYMALGVSNPRLGRPVIVVFTDGVDNVSWLAPTRVEAAAKHTDAVVYAVLETRHPWDRQRAVGRSRSADEDLVDESTRFLLDVTRHSGGRVWYARSLDHLREAFLEVLEEVRNRYVLQYEPRGVDPDGWHEVKVRLEHRKGKIRTRPGYRRLAPGSTAR